MNGIVKRITSTVVSVVLTVTAVLPTVNFQQKFDASAYSNAQKFVNTARAYSYLSGSPNETHYYYNAYDGAWCAFFCGFVAYQSGLTNYVPKLAYCDNQFFTNDGYRMEGYRSYYEKQGKFLYRESGFPSIGDLIVFETSLIPDGKADHIGIVTAVDTNNGMISTIEGNSEGGVVAEKNYSYTNPKIIGYCQVFSESNPSRPTQSAPVVLPVAKKETNEKINNWQLTNPEGGWLREQPNYGNKLGIISTGTLLYGDYKKNEGDWIYVKSAVTENGFIFDGYVYRSNLEPVSQSGVAPLPVTTAAAVEKTTASTTTTTAVITTTSASESSEKSTSTTTTVTTVIPVSQPAVTTTEALQPVTTEYTANHYVSSLIGANARSSALISDDNILGIIDTDEKLFVSYFEGEFAYCRVESTGQWVYLHKSTIDSLPPKNNYSYGARASHYVSSEIGCNFRKKGDYAGEVICILDTWQQVAVLTSPNELGFVYCELTLGDGLVHNGYIHIDGLTSC